VKNYTFVPTECVFVCAFIIMRSRIAVTQNSAVHLKWKWYLHLEIWRFVLSAGA